jgi:hypothetical protein
MAVGLVFAPAEEHIPANRECAGAKIACQTSAPLVSVDPHFTKVEPEPRFHEGTHPGAKALAARQSGSTADIVVGEVSISRSTAFFLSFTARLTPPLYTLRRISYVRTTGSSLRQ